MTFNWNEMFGEDYFIEIKNSERKYFGLNEIAETWQTAVYYSKVNVWYKRLVAFFDGDTIVKVISEEKRVLDDGTINLHNYWEFDTKLSTRNRETLLPLTARGKEKKLSCANILTPAPFGCSFHFTMNDAYNVPITEICVSNPRADKYLAMGEEQKIKCIRNGQDFRDFLQYYISTCPPDYFDRVESMKSAKHVTVKYRVGDIFKVEIDRTHYCYGIITGEINEMLKRLDLPERHSLRWLMTVPIMVRFYDIITENGQLTAKELEKLPLDRTQICSDNNIIWGTHVIVDHKEVSDELEFHLVCAKFTNKNNHFTVFTEQGFILDKIAPNPQEYYLHVEWGTATTELSSSQLPDRLRESLKNYFSPHSGVSMGIFPNKIGVAQGKKVCIDKHELDLLNEQNRELRNQLFLCLGLPSDCSFDDFAKKFGGLTKQEILQKLK